MHEMEEATDTQQNSSHSGNPGPSSAESVQYMGYRMERKSLDGQAKQVLFYAHDVQGQATLALVGTDTRGTGHFVYESEPDFTGAPPLRCTNRNRVMNWLAAFGATQNLDGKGNSETGKPADSRHASGRGDLQRPELDRNFVSIREESGKSDDGQHYRNYYLVDDQDNSMLAITGKDGPRRDRRYFYKAVPSLGHWTFDNSKHCTDWLDWVIGKRPQPPLSRKEQRKSKKKDVGEPEDAPRSKRPSLEDRVHCTDVESAFSSRSDLLDWVMKTPDEATMRTFQEWAERLGGIVTDDQPEEHMSGPSAKWMSTTEAMDILRKMDSHGTCLKLLETTRISRSVAMLKAHGNPEIASLASKVAAKWKSVASDALQIARNALQQEHTSM